MRIILHMDGLPIDERRHAQKIMLDLGIKYGQAVPQSVAACWEFLDVDESTVPAVLPDYLAKVSP